MPDQELDPITVAATTPPPRKGPVNVGTARVEQEINALDQQQEQNYSRQSALDTEFEKAADTRAKEAQPIYSDIEKATQDRDDFAKLFPKENLPTYKPKPLVDPKDYEQFSTAILAISLIAGALSKNWMGANESLAGAMEGYLEGNKELAQRRYDDYKTQFEEAKAKYQGTLKEYEDVLNSKNLTINQKFQELSILAAKNKDEDLRFAARQRSIDSAIRNVDSRRTTLENTLMRAQIANAQMDNKFNQHDQTALAMLTPEGKQLVMQTAMGGNMKLLELVRSKFADPAMSEVINSMAAEYSQAGVPYTALNEQMIQQRIQVQIQRLAQSWLTGTERISKAIDKALPRVTQLIENLNKTDPTMLNKPVNWAKNEFGNVDLGELKILMNTVGTEYSRMSKSPLSIAQMHASTEDWANKVFGTDVTLNTWIGVMRGIRNEMQYTHDSYASTLQDLKNQVIHPPDAPGGTPTTAPLSDADLLKKYGVH